MMNTDKPLIGPALSWDDLADLYPGTARTKPMDAIFEYFEDQPDKFYIDSDKDTIHLILERRVAGSVKPNTFKTVGCKYHTSQRAYTFMTYEECEVGDKAVVFTNGSWNVVTVIEIHDEPQLKKDHNYTWLVQVIDTTNYDKHIVEDGEGYPSVESRL